jgi:hypothetical protein
VRSALTRVARPSPRIDSDFLGNRLKPAPSRAVGILCLHMGECESTPKLVRKNAAYAWLFLARLTGLSTIRFIGNCPQDGSISLALRQLFFGIDATSSLRTLTEPSSFSFLHRTAFQEPVM